MIDNRELLAQVRRIQVRTRRLVTDVMAGGYTSVFRGSGIEFDEVREFTEGDDIRAVDWNVTARTGRPHVKKFMEERELTILLLLDVSASMGFGSVQALTSGQAARVDAASGTRSMRQVAAEFCGCIALAAARNNDKAGLIAFDQGIRRYVPAKKGSRHVLRLIREALAPAGRAPERSDGRVDDAVAARDGLGTDLAGALDYAARVQRKRAVVFVISDFLAPAWERSLRLLSRRHDVVAARLVDPSLEELPRAGLLQLRDPETGRLASVDTSSTKVRTEYARRRAVWDQEMVQALRRAHVDQLQLSTSDHSVADPILRFFRMRELRGARE